jgi:hypothetical protein
MSSSDVVKGAVVGGAVAALVMVSTSAVAGSGVGGVFNLGKSNTVNASTSLSGSTSGKSLQVTNKGSGTALGLTVRAGKPPLVVNSKAGKATNLNADKLDGKSSGYFASAGYSASFTDSSPVTMTSAGESHTLLSAAVPKGHYVVVARLQGITGNDGGGNNFRYDCSLGGADGTIDSPVYRVGMTNGQENYLTYQGVYSGSGPLTLTCRSANVHTLTALSGSLVATKVSR